MHPVIDINKASSDHPAGTACRAVHVSGRALRVLVVDDHDIQRLIVKRSLTKLGHHVREADSAEQAIELMRHHEVDLIISDWVMDGMDGADLCRHVRARSDGRYVYFMLMSSRDGREDLLLGMQAGADDFLRKPLDVDELGVRIRSGQRVLDLQSRLEARNEQLNDALQRIQQDIDAAGDFQKALLPRTDAAGAHLGVSWLFLPSNQVSGDALNFFALDERHLAFYLMDVSGHGVASAMVAMNVAQHLNPATDGCVYEPGTGTEHRRATDPASAMTRLNKQLCQQEVGGKYLTCVYGTIDRLTGVVRMVRAGHPVPMLVGNEAGQAALGDEGDLPVALFADATYSNITLQLQPGARLCLYSDGITECEAPNGDFFGEQRLHEFLKCHQSTPIAHLGERFTDEIRRWHGRAGEPFRDDVSLLVFEYIPGRFSDPSPT